MKVVFSENLGYCSGVKRAIELAEKNLPSVCTYGELTHNERVISSLEAKGIYAVNSLQDVNADKVIIRSHGVGEDEFNKLKASGKEIVDATCPFVRKIHNIVKEHYSDGYQIVIVGDAKHPEVAGINGWCNNAAIIISSENPEEENIQKLYNSEKLCFVSQTTVPQKKYSDIIKKIDKDRLKTVEIFDTICYTTVVRQSEADSLARKCTKVLVLGSSKSKNTKMLYSICKSVLKQTFFIESLDDIKNIKFSPDDTVGVLAGASTPSELIMEVKGYMSQNVEEVLVSDELKAGVEESLVSYREGKRVNGKVISADDKGIRLSIGGKYDGIIYADQVNIDGKYDPADFTEGMEIEAIIIGKKDADTDCIPLSKRKVDLIKEGDKIVDTVRDGSVFELSVTSDTKGGLLAKLGTYTVFVPASQVKEVGFPKDLKAYVKKKLRLTILEIDDNRHKIIASQKKVLVTERKEREEIFWANVVPNVVVSGTVKRITSFGAFVSVDGFDCLAHIVDLSWDHIKTVDEVLKIGETYDFLVLSVDREKGRVSLGYKQLQLHPFTVAMQKYPVGTVVSGKVVSIVPFGAFVQIEPGVEGLVHVSEAAHSFVKNMNEVVKVGDTVDVKVLAIDEAARRITLSMKACLPEEPKQEEVKKEASEEESKERSKKFANRPKKERKAKEEDDSQKEWNEESSFNPFADLLKNLNIEENK